MNRIVAPAVLAIAAACAQENEFVPPPPPTVAVTAPESRTVVEFLEYTGLTEAFERIELRARVAGFLQEVAYEPGSIVEEGDLLFRIDPAEYQAAYEAAEASVEARKAELALAEATLQRLESTSEGTVPEIQKIEARAQRDKSLADLKLARADLHRAELDLSYTEVKAPVRGPVERNLVDVGNLVGKGDPTLLATIVDDSRIYAYFEIPERALLTLLREAEEAGVERGAERPEVVMATEDGRGFFYDGVIDYGDPEVDAATGTVRVRAIFANDKRRLFPGQFVRIRIARRPIEDAMLVPQRAVSRDEAGHFVLVVGEGDVVEMRPVDPAWLEGELRVILDGLTEGDRVIVDGVLRARPGIKVRIEQPKGGQGASGSGATDEQG